MDCKIYVFKEENSDGFITYEQINIDLEKYDIINDNNLMILKPKLKIIKISKLDEIDKKNLNLLNSKILSCLINNKRPTNNKYFSILKNIYSIIKKGKIITKNTLLNYDTIEKNNKGFTYLKDIGISIQKQDANYTFTEIINQCIKSNIKLDIDIKLKSGDKIKYLIE